MLRSMCPWECVNVVGGCRCTCMHECLYIVCACLHLALRKGKLIFPLLCQIHRMKNKDVN